MRVTSLLLLGVLLSMPAGCASSQPREGRLDAAIPFTCHWDEDAWHDITVIADGNELKSLVVNGDVVPRVRTIPSMEDGTRGKFVIPVGTAGERRVHRYSWHCEDMCDSSLIFTLDGAGRARIVHEAHVDCGGRAAVNYYWWRDTTYTLSSKGGVYVLEMSTESRSGENDGNGNWEHDEPVIERQEIEFH